MSFSTIDALRESLAGGAVIPAEYAKKMMHAIPEMDAVEDRNAFIVQACKQKRVLNLGCASGGLHSEIKKASLHVVGVDKDVSTMPGFIGCDLDEDPEAITRNAATIDLVVAGEILEHLSNPGNLLRVLTDLRCDLLITVPNAFSRAARRHMEDEKENVNRDHVCWYSYTTLKTLLGRYGFEIIEGHWYNGEPLFAEGLIVLARQKTNGAA